MKKIVFIICLFATVSSQLTAQVVTAPNNNVGIGTSTPNSKLHVYSTVAGDDVTIENTATNGQSSIWVKPGAGYQWAFGATGGSHATFPNSFYVYNTVGNPGVKFLINGEGKVGINNFKPLDFLDINSANFRSVNTTELWDYFNSNTKSFINFGMNARGIDAEHISNAGALYGIKLTVQNPSPSSNLLEKKTVVYGLVSEDPSGGYSRAVGAAIYTSDRDQVAVERMRVTGGGDVVIGQTQGRAKLTISAPDRTFKSAIAIRQSNALNYGFDFGLDQTLDGNMYLKMIQNDAVAKENVMVFDRAKGYVGVGTSPKAPFHMATSGYPGDDAWLIIQRRDSNAAHMGLNLFPSGTVSNTNKAWGLGVWGGTNDLRLWNWNGTDNNIFLTALGKNGYVGIGTTNPQEMLSVKGTVLAQKVKVSVKSQDWPDYVFSKNYKLRSLSSLENYINESSHLPDVPSAEEVGKGALDIGSTQAMLLRKIEELSLYVIELNKKIERLEKGK